MTIQGNFQGVYPILATPFDDRETVDLESFGRIVRFMADIGVDGVTILGVLGESGRLVDSERERLIRSAVAAAGGARASPGAGGPGAGGAAGDRRIRDRRVQVIPRGAGEGGQPFAPSPAPISPRKRPLSARGLRPDRDAPLPSDPIDLLQAVHPPGHW